MVGCATAESRVLLLVDDEEGILDFLRDLVSDLADRVSFALNCEDAVGIARELDPQVALVDVCMPRMGGVALVRALREHNPALRVIVFSGLDGAEVSKKIGDMSVDAVVGKPFEPVSLREEVDRAFVKAGFPQLLSWSKR